MTLAATLRERRRQEAIDEIARAAVDLFERDGFDKTSVDAIAEAAGCSPRTFYRYFGSKEDVMFHDLPVVIAEIDEMLSSHLADGLDLWAAVSETFVELIQRFESTDEAIPTRRMELWLNEPSLRTRYMTYVIDAEEAVAGCLYRHLGTTPETDDLPDLIAVAATGAYRVTILTHHPQRMGELTKHLRAGLATLGDGIARLAKARQDGSGAPRKKRASRNSGRKKAS